MKYLENHQLEFLSNYISSTMLDKRISTVLTSYRPPRGIAYVCELLCKTYEELLKNIEGLGEKRLSEIKDLFSSKGLNLDILREEAGFLGQKIERKNYEEVIDRLKSIEFSDDVFSCDYCDKKQQKLLELRTSMARQMITAFYGEHIEKGQLEEMVQAVLNRVPKSFSRIEAAVVRVPSSIGLTLDLEIS